MRLGATTKKSLLQRINFQQNKSVGLLVILTCFPSEKRHLQCLLIPLNKGLVFSRENLSLSI